MSGIVFFTTTTRERIVEFYTRRLDFEIWLEQSGCTIVQFENLLVGFCTSEATEADGIVTVALDDVATVDDWYDRLDDVADAPPSENDEYRIYNFFGTDPDGRKFEVQTFLHETEPI